MNFSRSPVLNTAIQSAIGAVGIAALWVGLSFVPNTSGHGTANAVLLQGLLSGLVGSLTAVGVILVYRTTRILNLAQAAIGSVGALLTFDLVYMTGWMPFLVAVVLGIAVGGVVGFAFDLSFGRRFFTAPRLILTIVTLFAVPFVTQTLSPLINQLPIFPRLAQRSAEQITGGQALGPLMPFSDFYFTVGGLLYPFGFVHIFAFVGSIATLIGLGLFLQFSRSGKAIRALAENPERAGLLGISTGMLSSLIWIIAGALSAATLIFQGMLLTPAATGVFSQRPPTAATLLAPLAAAVLGRFENMTATVFAAIAISMVTLVVGAQQSDYSPLIDVGLFVILSAGLLLMSQKKGRSESSATGFQIIEEIRPVPREMLALPTVKIARVAGPIALGLALVVLPFTVGTGQVTATSGYFIDGIVGISLVVLTGWGAQASLGQYAFVGVGALVSGILADRYHVSFWAALPASMVVTAVISAVLGFPALRIKGIFLIATTLAFAVAFRSVMFDDKFFGWILPGPLSRPTLFIIDFSDEHWMYFLVLGFLILTIVVVSNLRSSRFGRILIAIRENEPNAQSASVAALRVKLTAFAIAGAIAGLAGSLLAFHQQGVNAGSFEPDVSFLIFLLVVVGGAGSVWGALLGVIGLQIFDNYMQGFGFAGVIVSAIIPLVIFYISPGGAMAIVVQVRDAIFRIIAQRNQLVVPALFADIDPEALHLRLIPLAEPLGSSGLSTITERFQLGTSRLARLRSVTVGGVSQPKAPKGSKEARAFGAAAKRAEDVEEAAATAPAAVKEEDKA